MRIKLYFSVYELSLASKMCSFGFLMCSLQVGNNLTVNGIDFYITDTFGEGMFESCKDVKFGTMNTRAIEFIGAGAKNFRGICSLISVNDMKSSNYYKCTLLIA